MPIYEFSCKKCGHLFEALRLSSRGFKGITCPKCDSKQVEKRMSTFAASAGGTSSVPCDSHCPSPAMGGSCSSGMCGLN